MSGTKKEKEVQTNTGVDDFLNMAGDFNEEDDLILNMDEISELKREALPAGTYDAKIDEVEFKRSSNNNPMLSIRFALTADEYKGRKLFTNIVLNNEFGLGRLKNTLMRLLPTADLKKFNARTDGNMLIGCDCRVKVKTRLYDGEMVNDVKDVLAPAGGGTGAFI